ncbi:MAG: hypothetical protein K5912_04255 [Alphaproteobacteria bacterium]|nr:hypothetical protein [Alphaproteobacteria bacterium]
MNKTLVLMIILLTMIVIMTSFDLSLGGNPALVVPPEYQGRTLFVCPGVNEFWDGISTSISPFSKYIIMGLFFGGIILVFVWGWAMYQNLLTDKFKKEDFSKPWQFTKLLIWAVLIVTMLLYTPNRFRYVEVSGSPENWVLCEATSPNARMVVSDKVTAK